MPLPNRWLSALLLRCEGQVILCDCGEGTQISWKMSGWGFRDVSTIVLSHLHADHVAGLPGVLFMLAHAGRTEPVTIYGPASTHQIASGLMVIAPRMPFPIQVAELAGSEELEIAGGLTMRSLAVEHRIPCLSYTFERPRAGRFEVERARALGVPVPSWSRLQRGEEVEVDDRVIQPSDVLGPPRRGLKVGFVTDTRPTTELPGFVRDADLLVCEGMYGDPSLHERGVERGHMLFNEAAAIATQAGARRLWLTHFSPSVEHPAEFLPVAQAIFPNAEIGQPHRTLTLAFEDE